MATKRSSYVEAGSPKKFKVLEAEDSPIQQPVDGAMELGSSISDTSWPGSPVNISQEVMAMFSRDNKAKSSPAQVLDLKLPPGGIIPTGKSDTKEAKARRPSNSATDKPHMLNNNNYDSGVMMLAYPCQRCSYFSDKLEELTKHYELEHPSFSDFKRSLNMPNLFGLGESSAELNSSESSADPKHQDVSDSPTYASNLASNELIGSNGTEGTPGSHRTVSPVEHKDVLLSVSAVEHKDVLLSVSAAVEEATTLDLSLPHKVNPDTLVVKGAPAMFVTSRPSVLSDDQSVSDLLKEASSATLMAESVTKMAAMVTGSGQGGLVSNSHASTVNQTSVLARALASNPEQILDFSSHVPDTAIHKTDSEDLTTPLSQVQSQMKQSPPPLISIASSPIKSDVPDINTGSPIVSTDQHDDPDSIMRDLDLDPDVYYMCRVCQRFLVPQRERLWEHVMGSHFPGTRPAPTGKEEENKKLGKALRRWFVSEDGSKYSATIADVSIFWHVRHQCKLCPYQTPARLGIITHVYSHIKDSVIYVCKYCGDQKTEINESLAHHSNDHAGAALAIEQCFIKSEDQYVVFPVKEKGKPKVTPPQTPQQMRQDVMKRLIEKIKPEVEGHEQNIAADAPGTLPVLTAAVLSQNIHAIVDMSPPISKPSPSPPTPVVSSQMNNVTMVAVQEQTPRPKKKPSKPKSRTKSPRAAPSPKPISQFAKPGASNGPQFTVTLDEEPDLYVINPEIVFLCRACPFYSSSKVIIREHVRAHNKSFACGICKSYNASSRNFLAVHYGMQHPGEVVQCKTWANELELKMLYMKEETSKHLKFLSKTPADTAENLPFRCHMCEFATTEDDLIRSHVHLHHDAPSPYMCSLCNFLCATESEIKDHMNGIHPGPDQSFRWDENLKAEMELYFEHVPPGNNAETQMREVPQQLVMVLTRPTPEQPMQYAFSETVQQKRKSYYPKEHFKYLIVCAICATPLKDFQEAEVHLSSSHAVPNPYICKMCGTDAQSYAKKCHMLTHMRKRHSLDPYGVYELCKTQTDLMTPYLVIKTADSDKQEASPSSDTGVIQSSQDQWNDSQEALEAHVRSLQDIAEAMMAHVETPMQTDQDTQEVHLHCPTSGLLEEAVKQAQLPTGDGKEGLLEHCDLALSNGVTEATNLSMNANPTTTLSASSMLAQVAQEHAQIQQSTNTTFIPSPMHIVRPAGSRSQKPGKFRCAYCGFSSNESMKMIAHVRTEHSSEPQVYMTT